ncbi:transcriptional regulator, GntR family [Saccharopolyspora kobensis]|uniref:Transcriptional regulator, GntR family n=1 Tax=Saccharopolyspora kobensis TaxID=146035 RepID=A0A1H5WIG1_9PSEU|nr:transcriptional regulator, GntR family [Saccharopolyspora kobensis]SFD75581.1 transcriptional regulator, GntR family [Saccharopolyspora kobensis]
MDQPPGTGEETPPAVTGPVDHTRAVRAPSIVGPPSLVELAATTLRRMIIGGDLLCGQRIVENRLTHELGISRPPLREALRVLEREGLVRQVPRKGVIVTPLTLHDIYEICTLRAEFEALAVRLGVPVREAARMRRCRQALQRMSEAADAGDEPDFLERSFDFHVSVVGLSGHQRLEEAYRSLQLQLMLSMALNRKARQDRESLTEDVARHRRLLEIIDAGDPAAVLAELAAHGDRTFLDGIETKVDGHTEESLRWLHRQRRAQEDQ